MGIRSKSGFEKSDRDNGCPVCGWDGEVAVTTDYSHNYYTHVIIRNGEVFEGSVCTKRTRKPKRGLIIRILDWIGRGL